MTLYSLKIGSEADKEYTEAYGWYELQLEGLGDRFEAEVEKQILKILNNPETYHICKDNFRECSIYNFPFTIVYKVNKRKKTVFLSAIFHSSRDPKEKFRKR